MAENRDVLYHYTKQSGLLGILESDSIWATKIQYLSDYSEYHLALDLARKILQRHLDRERNEKEHHKAQCLLDSILTIQNMNICVCSFSEKRDVLSQWRGYAGGTAGYSVGFHVSHLRQQAKAEGFDLVKCVYEEPEHEKLVAELVDETMLQDFNTVPYVDDPESPGTFKVLLTDGGFALRVAQLAPRLKSEAFREEDEWRLVSTRGISVKRMSFRSSGSMLTPFFKLPLGTDKAKYLHSVTVGPTPYAPYAEEATRTLLAHWGVAGAVEVLSSSVPYRG